MTAKWVEEKQWQMIITLQFSIVYRVSSGRSSALSPIHLCSPCLSLSMSRRYHLLSLVYKPPVRSDEQCWRPDCLLLCYSQHCTSFPFHCTLPFSVLISIPISTWQFRTSVTTFWAVAFCWLIEQLKQKLNEQLVDTEQFARTIESFMQHTVNAAGRVVNIVRKWSESRNVKWIIFQFDCRYQSWHICGFGCGP